MIEMSEPAGGRRAEATPPTNKVSPLTVRANGASHRPRLAWVAQQVAERRPRALH